MIKITWSFPPSILHLFWGGHTVLLSLSWLRRFRLSLIIPEDYFAEQLERQKRMYLSGVNSLCTMKLAVETTSIADYSNHKCSKFSSWWNFMCQKKYRVCFFFFVFAFLILSMHRLENVLTMWNRFPWIVIINPIFLFFFQPQTQAIPNDKPELAHTYARTKCQRDIGRRNGLYLEVVSEC